MAEIEAIAQEETVDPGRQRERLKIPKGTYFLLGTTLFERLAFYMVENSLIPFILDMKDDAHLADTYYNIFIVLIYATTLPAALLAETWTGGYKAWITMAMFSILGMIIFLFSSFPVSNRNVLLAEWPLFQIGMYVYCLGIGGLKLTYTLGGDQYDPQDTDLISTHFSNLYIIANFGSIIVYFTYPFIQAEPLHLQDSEAPFTIPLIVATASFFLALILMVSGRPYYKVVMPRKFTNVLDFFRCLWIGYVSQMRAWGRRLFSSWSSSEELKLSSVRACTDKRHHWLDKAEEKLGTYFVSDVKVVLNICGLFALYPVFWTLYFQTVSYDCADDMW